MNLSREKYLKLTSPMVSHINVGSGSDMTIKELANLIKRHCELCRKNCF